MARRREVPKREILPDPKFKELLVAKFVNCMMEDGKKSAAEKAFYGALEIIDGKGPQGLSPFKSSIENFPQLNFLGQSYEIPSRTKPFSFLFNCVVITSTSGNSGIMRIILT